MLFEIKGLNIYYNCYALSTHVNQNLPKKEINIGELTSYFMM